MLVYASRSRVVVNSGLPAGPTSSSGSGKSISYAFRSDASTRFDPNLEPHHHLVCDVCGRIDDVHAEFPGVAVPASVDAGFEVTATEIVFRGRCAECAAADRARAT
jgi:hypothetical protein